MKPKTNSRSPQSKATKVVIASILFVILMTSAGSAFSKDGDLWESDKKKIENMSGEESCQDQSKILWKWAKEGNSEARFWLFSALAGGPDMSSWQMPGNTGNIVTNIRDLTIMAVHSYDYQPADDSKYGGSVSDYKEAARYLFQAAGFYEHDNLEGGNFSECTKDQGRVDCATIAVKNNFVPSFEEYAAQIDLFVSQGTKFNCK